MLAEWENPKSIFLTLPSEHTDWDYILEEAIAQYRRLLDSLIEAGEKVILLCKPESPDDLKEKILLNGGKVVTSIKFNDTWTRDYGPITIKKDDQLRELDFGFNGWGLKFAADYDNLVNLRMSEEGSFDPSRYENKRDLVLEGGSVETDGHGTILTTSRCLCSPNRNGGKDKATIEKILKETLGADHILWLDYGFLAGDDTDSHIDTLARMAPDGTIIYVSPPADRNDIHFEEMTKMENQLKEFKTLRGKPFRLIPLPFSSPIFDEEGTRLPATYANYLVTGKNIFVPVYNQPENDKEAISQIKKAFPKHSVYAVDCTTLIKQHGSLHCSTMQLY